MGFPKPETLDNMPEGALKVVGLRSALNLEWLALGAPGFGVQGLGLGDGVCGCRV